MRSANPIPTFEELARKPDDAIDVVLGAALVARDVNEDVDVARLVACFEDFAAPLRDENLAGQSAIDQVRAVSDRFKSLGFRGNVEDYYDPRNSLLPDVLERRLGIPITLTLVWCEIARRNGVNAHGVGFPGHFLARVDGADAGPRSDMPVIVDPFGGGRIVATDDARELLRRALGHGAELDPSLFAPASSRMILVRLLTNLKAIWASRGDHARAFVAIDRIVTLVPDSARMLRERAAIALRLGIDELARADFTRVLSLEPEAPDAPLIKKRLAELADRSPRSMN
jgi:regulator of sirC expression with transglutaminase-like and TPR domain